MKRLIQAVAGLCLLFSVTGCCCFTPGYVDPCHGVAYGGGFQPCRLPDPFAIFRCCPWWPLWGCGPACGWHDPCYTPPTVCPDTCCPSPIVGSYQGGGIPTPVTGTYVPSTLPSVPAGIYEEATPAESEPTPATPTSSIIFQRHGSGGAGQQPIRDARNQQWIPARF